MKSYEGACHCGAVRFEADLDLAEGTMRCNCSYCAKTRAWLGFAKGAEALRVKKGEDVLAAYRWTPAGQDAPRLTHSFCQRCGTRLFGRGELAALGGTFYGVSINVLAIDAEELSASPLRYVDGVHDRFDVAPPHPELV